MYKPKGIISVKQAVIENAAAAQPRTPAELAQELGVRVDRVYECISRLRRAGRLRPSERQVTGAVIRPEPPSPACQRAADPDEDASGAVVDSLDARTILEDLDQQVVLTELDRRRILSRLANTAPAPVRVQAVRALEEMDRLTGRQVGPPEPMGPEERIERLSVLIAGCGPDLGHAAMQLAIETWKIEAEGARRAASRSAG